MIGTGIGRALTEHCIDAIIRLTKTCEYSPRLLAARAQRDAQTLAHAEELEREIQQWENLKQQRQLDHMQAR